MIWIIAIESLIILLMGWMIWDAQKAMRIMIGMWEEEKNEQWLEMMKESGVKIIKID